MKCPTCGSEIGNSKFCEACGTQIAETSQNEQERKKACPECGSSNIQFRRENQGEVRGKSSKQIIHRTVGFCKDCGATWYPNTSANEVPKKRKTWLWVLGWLLVFPLPLTILMLRKKEMNAILKYGIIAVAWLIYLLIGLGANSSNNTKNADAGQTNGIYANAEIVDLMNGTGTEKIGTISVVRAEQSACTDEALADWYFNYVKEHSDCNYHIIAYTDNPTKGVYTMGKGSIEFIQKDVALTEDADGSFSIGDDAGSTYYSVDANSKTISVRDQMVDASTLDDVKAKVEAVIPDEYKNGEQYAVDVAGVEGGTLDCSLTLVNESFADADYQSIAMEIAKTVKELDLNIGYFNIAFQSDDNTLNAVSNIDDLSTQDVSEISTKTYNQ